MRFQHKKKPKEKVGGGRGNHHQGLTVGGTMVCGGHREVPVAGCPPRLGLFFR